MDTPADSTGVLTSSSDHHSPVPWSPTCRPAVRIASAGTHILYAATWPPWRHPNSVPRRRYRSAVHPRSRGRRRNRPAADPPIPRAGEGRRRTGRSRLGHGTQGRQRRGGYSRGLATLRRRNADCGTRGPFRREPPEEVEGERHRPDRCRRERPARQIGWTTKVADQSVTLDTEADGGKASGLADRLLATITDPNVAYRSCWSASTG